MLDKDDIFNYAYMAKSDIKAYKKLIAETNKLIAESNGRLRELEKASVKTEASKYITYQIKRLKTPKSKRFTRVKLKENPNVEDVKKIAQLSLGFIESKTSTLEGYLEVKKQRYDTLSTLYGDIKDIDAFDEYLKSEFFQKFVKFDSDMAMQYGIDHIDNIEDIATIEQIYKDWQKGKMTTATMIDDKTWYKYE